MYKRKATEAHHMQYKIAKRILLLFVFIFHINANSEDLSCKRIGAISPAYFGMHIHRFHDQRYIPNIEFGSWRLWDAGVSWKQLQPSRDQWDFRRLDLALSVAKQKGVEVGLTLGMTPQWAASRPNEKSFMGDGAASEPRDLADWDNYVRTIVSRYKGRINYYEIWNEPDTTGFYSGDIQKMVNLSERAYKIIKDNDPSALVVSPSPAKPHSISWFNGYVNAGGLTYSDIVGYHFYTDSKIPEDIIPFIQKVRAILDAKYISKPLWNTESGILNGMSSGSGINISSTAHLSRWLVLGACLGLTRFEYYAWDNARLGLFDPDAVKNRQQTYAYISMRKWLQGAILLNCNLRGKTSECRGEKNSYKFSIIWADTQTDFQVPNNASSIEDLFGTTLRMPIETIELNSNPILMNYKK